VFVTGTRTAKVLARIQYGPNCVDLDELWAHDTAYYAANKTSYFCQYAYSLFKKKHPELSLPNAPGDLEANRATYPDAWKQWGEAKRTGIREIGLWKWVGDHATSSPTNQARVILQGSQFSNTGDGFFYVCGDPSKMVVDGGLNGFWDALVKHNIVKEAAGAERAAIDATLLRNGVNTVDIPAYRALTLTSQGAKLFRIGSAAKGAFVIAGLVQTGLHIYHAHDRAKAIVKEVGGWTGAAAVGGEAGLLAASILAPLNIAVGPGQVVYGGLVLLAGLGGGVVGYIAGSGATGLLYEVIMHPADPKEPLSTIWQEGTSSGD
jgi:hypothetical protein